MSFGNKPQQQSTLIVQVDSNLHLESANGQVVVSSRVVAERFGKEHKNVLRDIENIISEGMLKIEQTHSSGGAQNCAGLFIEGTYQHQQNKQQYREYLLTRDGFTLLAMGFTGKEALHWKLKYIEAFNKMEKQIKQSNPFEGLSKELQAIIIQDKKLQHIEHKVTELEETMPLFNVECKELQSKVRQVGIGVLGGYKTPAYNDNSLRGKVYSDIQNQLKREFGVTRYEAIKRSQLGLAERIVEVYKVPMVLGNEIMMLNNQMTLEK